MTTETNLEIKGNLMRHFPAELLVEITQTKLSGSLRFSNKEQKIIIYVEMGKVVFAASNSRQHRLFQVLLDENQISKRDLLEIGQVTNDLYLAKHLVDENIFRKEDIDNFLHFQISKIVQTVLEWQVGEWIFSPLARVQSKHKFHLNIASILQEFAKSIDKQQVSGRFKTLEEIFYRHPSKTENDLVQSNLNSQEFFVLSRFGESKLEIKEIQKMSSLPNNDVLYILYKLWLCGLVCRRNWNSPFNKNDLSKINAAKYSLIKSAVSIEEEELQRKADEEKLKLEAEKTEQAAKKTIEEEKQKEKHSLEKYLKQVENAATHYEMFGIASDAEISDLKNAYFSFAKKFHPDIFYKEVDKVLLRRIQSAFTEIANAYDTLKDEKSREVYDFRLRKAIETLNKSESASNASESDLNDNSVMADEDFETGYALLTEERFNEAIPYLARAVQLDSENARYHAFYGKALSHDSKQHRKAATEINEAINLNSRNSTYRLMLAELYVKVGLLTSAKGELNRLLEFEPNNAEALSLLDILDNK
ncbi:MAG: J domain-containing protein [Aridibacter sp.]